MTIYTVHPPSSGARRAPRDDVALAAESFSWGAFLFGPFWLVGRRLWLWLAVWLVCAGAFVVFATLLAGDVSGGALITAAALAQVLFGFEANDLRRRSLERSGRQALDVVSARSENAAARRFFRRQAESARESDRSAEPGPDRPPPAPDKGFLTLFPDERAP